MPHAREHLRSPYRMAGAVALAWLGMYVHNIADLPNLAGGFATVLPLPVLPFKPEQSLRHYMFHLLYALTQLPLLLLVQHELRQLRSRNGGAA